MICPVCSKRWGEVEEKRKDFLDMMDEGYMIEDIDEVLEGIKNLSFKNDDFEICNECEEDDLYY